METKRTMTEEERQRMGWASEQEKKTAVTQKVDSFLREDSEQIKEEKRIIGERSRWALHFGLTIKPKEVAEESVDLAYTKVFKDKSLSKSQKTKRAASYNEKERRQNLVNAEMFQYHTIRDRAVHMIAEETTESETKQEFLDKHDATKSKYSEATRDVAVYAYLSQQKSLGDLAKKFYKSAASTETEDSAPELLIREMEKLDLSEFEYSTDSEFATGLSLKMAKIRAFSHVEDYLRQVKLGRLRITGAPVDLTALAAKAEVLKSIKTDYESRMKMMESPYYVMLAKKDLDGLSDDELNDLVTDVKNEELKAYVAAYKKNKANKLFKKGEKIIAKEEKIRKTLEKQNQKVDGETDALNDQLKALAKEKDFKFETGHKRAGIMAVYYYEKYGVDGDADVRMLIDKYTPILQDKKLSSSQKKKISQMVDDLKETATMFEHLKAQSASEVKNVKGGAMPSMALFVDQGYRTLAFQSPAFRKLTERLQAERDERARSRYFNYCDTRLRNVLLKIDGAKTKSGLQLNRNNSKDSITAQEVYNNDIEIIRYKKEKGVELSEEEKALLGGTADINEEAVAQKKQDLAATASAKLRVVSDDYLNTDKPFIDIERDWMVLTEARMREYNTENGVYRKDIGGIDRMEHHEKFKKGGAEMQKAAEEDVDNLVYSFLTDKEFSMPDMQVEEPLLTALKGYMMFMMIGENAIMKKTKEKELARSKADVLSKLVPKDAPDTDPNKVELKALRDQADKLKTEETRISAFSLRFRTSVPISLTYLPNVLKLQAFADARQVIMQDEDGTYKEQLLKTLDEKEAALKAELEENKISAYKTTANGVPIEITENQKDMLKKLSVVFDAFTDLRRRKSEAEDEGEGKEDKEIGDEAQAQLEQAMQIVMDYNKLDEA